MLVVLFILKYVATLLTIGAGGSGGVLAPSLVLGTALGGAFGTLLHAAHPAWVPSPATYAIAGMGTVFAGTARAPLTAIALSLELTRDYHLALGMAAACAVSYLLYGLLARYGSSPSRLTPHGIRSLMVADVRAG